MPHQSNVKIGPQVDHSLDIYGQDDCGCAADIAQTALTSPNPNANSGSPFNNDESSRGRGTGKYTNDNEGDNFAHKTTIGTGDDSRGRTAGNHGKQRVK
jgi:hypothetical protein